jgi:hypothetical protein
MAKDSIARVLASGAGAVADEAQADIVKSASLTKLRRLMSSAKQFNASDASAMSSPVTITPQAGVTSGLNAQSRPVTDASADTIFTVLGGVKLVYSGTMWRFWCITRPVSGAMWMPRTQTSVPASRGKPTATTLIFASMACLRSPIMAIGCL